ncbi:MAG: AraC family transcriptional regulator [Herbinix sp.]|jgi:AraC-like DNA-binding protein|nr:AraC family transcriptional regulator [Herbinix sp.]
MILPKRIFPKAQGKKVNALSNQVEKLPFFVKECGYSSEKKLKLGSANNYSDYLLLYSLDGVVRFTKDTHTQYISHNKIIVTACNVPLTFTRTSKEWNYFYVIIGGAHSKFYYNMIRNRSCVFATSPLSSILDLFIEIYNLQYKNEMEDNIHSSLLIHKLLYELYKISTNIENTKSITPVQETIINNVIKYISKNYKHDLDLDTVCNEVSFSKYYFCKIFKEHTGVTIHQYISEYRVEKSKDLLTYSKLSINAIATSVGFKNTLTYSRSFERSMHMTPTEYRKYF